MKARDLFERVQTIIQDEDGTRWPLSELCNWLNDGQRAAVEYKPTASTATVRLDLKAGARQELRYPYISILRIMGNQNTEQSDGSPRRVPTTADRDMLAAFAPDWQDERRASQQARHFLFEETDPRSFYVYPPNDGTGALSALVCIVPADVSPTADPDSMGSYDVPLGLDDMYFNCLVNYVLAYSYLKDAQFNANAMQRAVMHIQQFGQLLGVRVSMDAFMSPNAKAGIPSVAPGVDNPNG